MRLIYISFKESSIRGLIGVRSAIKLDKARLFFGSVMLVSKGVQ